MSVSTSKPMKVPNAAHPIAIEPNVHRIVVKFAGKVIADTKSALTLKEASLPVVQYIPREDVDMSLLERTSHESHCPFKGDASYYSINAGGRASENAIWTYEAPYEAVAAIKDRLAFYPSRVDSIEETA